MSAGCGCSKCTAESEEGARREREEIVRDLEQQIALHKEAQYERGRQQVEAIIKIIKARGEKVELDLVKEPGTLNKVCWQGSDSEGLARAVFDLVASVNRLIQIENERRVKE